MPAQYTVALHQCRGSEVRPTSQLAPKRTSEPERHWHFYDSSVPLDPKFAKVAVEQSCELRVRDTRREPAGQVSRPTPMLGRIHITQNFPTPAPPDAVW